MRFRTVVLAAVAFLGLVGPVLASDPTDVSWTFDKRIGAVEKDVAQLRKDIAELKGTKAAATAPSVVTYTRVCSPDGTCRLVPTSAASASCGCANCDCTSDAACAGANCPANNLAAFSTSYVGAASAGGGCASCGTAGATGDPGTSGSSGASTGYTPVFGHPIRNIIHGQGPIRRLFGKVRGCSSCGG